MSIPTISVVDQLSAAMSAKSLEHQVIASNIANSNTHGYQRMKLSFEHAMDRAQATVVPDRSTAVVSVEEDLVALSTNVGRYQAMARALTRYFAIANAITNPSRG